MSTLKTNNIQHVDRSDPSIIINTDGSVSIAGTVSYEDSTNIDSVGIITGRSLINAQKQVHVGTGVSVKAGGLNVTAGITTVQALQATTGTFTGDVDIADKIIHTGDTNTAIRFPAADTVSVETGGSEAIRVDSSQRLLIGSTSARVESNGFASPLQVEGTSTATSSVIIARNSANASSSQLIFQKSRGTSVGSNTVIQSGDAVGTIIFEGSDGTNTDSLASIIGACDGTPGTNDVPGRLVFSTTADGAASPTERLRINSTGNVGLGVVDPNILNEPAKFQELTLGGKTEGAAIHLKDVDGNVSAGMFTSDSTNALIVRTITNHPIIIRTNNDEKVRITNTGLIGIGTDNPLSGAAGARVNIYFEDQTTYDSTTNRANGLIINNQASGGYSSLELAQRTTSGNTYGSAIINAVDPQDGNQYGADLTFQTRATGSGNYGERMRITATGQVLIGGQTDNSNAGGFKNALQVEGTSATSSSISVVRNSNDENPPYINFGKSRGTSVNSNTALSDNDVLGQLDWSGADGSGAFNNFAGIKAYVDGTPGNSDAPGRLVFFTTPDGSTSPAERLRISSSGQVRMNNTGDPAADLHVGGTGEALNAYFQTSRSSGAYHHYAIGNSGASLGYIGSAGQISASGASDSFAFRSEGHLEFCSGGSTQRVRVASNGVVHVNSVAGGQAVVAFGDPTGNTFQAQNRIGGDTVLVADESISSAISVPRNGCFAVITGYSDDSGIYPQPGVSGMVYLDMGASRNVIVYGSETNVGHLLSVKTAYTSNVGDCDNGKVTIMAGDTQGTFRIVNRESNTAYYFQVTFI